MFFQKLKKNWKKLDDVLIHRTLWNIGWVTVIEPWIKQNNLSDGDELSQFLKFLPGLSTLSLAGNKFSELPSNTLHGNPGLINIDLADNPMESFPESFFNKQKLSKKSDLKFSCSMKYVPIDILINNPKTAKSFLAAAQFC